MPEDIDQARWRVLEMSFGALLSLLTESGGLERADITHLYRNVVDRVAAHYG